MAKIQYKKEGKSLCVYFMQSTSGNSLPMVMLVALVVMIISAAVAQSTMQMFSITKGGFNDQMTYLAAETALERSIDNLEMIITQESYPTSRGFHYLNAADYIGKIIDKMNETGPDEDTDIIKKYDNIKAHENMNVAKVDVRFAWYGGTSSLSGNQLTFPIEITATASMENNIFKSYGKKAVAVREFSVWVYNPFKLNGAIYTLGDVVAKGGETATIEGDIYAFGTGLVQPNQMEQYYNGGVCATFNETLHVKGNIFTRSLVRAGSFFDSDGPDTNSANIIVDGSVVAQGIDVFGSNDNIVVIEDAYTFDDIEMHGEDSYIGINGNYFGLNYGDGENHDTSSSIVNMAPKYGGANRNSRIAINGDMYINGVTYRITSLGNVGHQMEAASLTWHDDEPVYIKEGVNEASTTDYISILKTLGPPRNGFSILWKANWTNVGSVLEGDWLNWSNWVAEIKNNAIGFANNITLPAASSMTGYCANAIAANDTIYFMDDGSNSIDYKYVKQQTNSSAAVSKLSEIGINHNKLQSNLSSLINLGRYTDKDLGVPAALNALKNDLESRVEVFARKTYAGSTITYDLNEGESPNPLAYPTISEFMRLKVLLDAKFDNDPLDGCIVEFDPTSTDTVDINDYLVDKFNDESSAGEDYQDYYFLVLNYNPEKVIRVSDKFNGIIFSLGMVELLSGTPLGAQVNGSIIAAGQGYSSSSPYKAGSAADSSSSLPRVDVTNAGNRTAFDSWGYAALVINGNATITFDKDDLFAKFEAQTGSRQIILQDIFK